MSDRNVLTLKRPLSLEKETQLSEQLKAAGLKGVSKTPEKQQGSKRLESQEKRPKHKDPANPEHDDASAKKRAKDHDRAQTKKKRQEVQAALIWLCETYPEAFNRENPKPLKNNIHEDIFLKLSEGHPVKTKIRQALGYYTNGKRYLKAFAEASQRVDLNGIEVEPIAEANKGYAEERRQYFKERFAQRKKSREESREKRESEPSALSPKPVEKAV